MNKAAIAGFGVMLLSILSSCNGSQPLPPSQTESQPDVISDTFFSGCAYLDQNANGAMEPDEVLLGGMTFTVTLQSGGGFGADTSEGECAFITVPAALPAEAWPIRARMAAPDGAVYVAIGPSEVTLEYPDTRAGFPFTTK